MTTRIHMYAESRHRGNWVADRAKTFLKDEPNRFGWTNTQMDRTPCPEDYRFFGLMTDQVRSTWPWSFQERGLPQDASMEVKELSATWGVDGYGHNHVTHAELIELLAQLAAEPSPSARDLQHMVSQMINNLAERNPYGVDPDDHRIVFWFDN